jgi:hypothetical protein
MGAKWERGGSKFELFSSNSILKCFFAIWSSLCAIYRPFKKKNRYFILIRVLKY